jgi:hypothetical protein
VLASQPEGFCQAPHSAALQAPLRFGSKPEHRLRFCGSACRFQSAFFQDACSALDRRNNATLRQKKGRGLEGGARSVGIIRARYLAGDGGEGRRRRRRLGEVVDEIWAQQSRNVEPLHRLDLRSDRKPRRRRKERCGGFRYRQPGNVQTLCGLVKVRQVAITRARIPGYQRTIEQNGAWRGRGSRTVIVAARCLRGNCLERGSTSRPERSADARPSHRAARPRKVPERSRPD